MIVCPGTTPPVEPVVHKDLVLPDFVRADGDYALVFVEDFTGAQLDPTKWRTHLLWNGPTQITDNGGQIVINTEDEYYVDVLNDEHTAQGLPDPFVLNGDTLKIMAAPATNPLPPTVVGDGSGGFRATVGDEIPKYTSGVITTNGNFDFQYGYVEVRMKPPCGATGSWPAAWLLNSLYNANKPEIDFVELVEGNGFSFRCANQAYHYTDDLGTFWTIDGAGVKKEGQADARVIGDCHTNTGQSEFWHAKCLPTGESYCDDFHTYGVLWTPEKIVIFVDGEVTNSLCEAGSVPHENMYLILNLAIGGWFPGDPDESKYPAGLEIDYACVYQK